MKEKKIVVDESPVLDTTENAVDKKDNKKKKIAILITVGCLILVGGISWFFLYALPEKDQNPMFDPEKQEEIIGMYGSTQQHLYYPIDYDIDIMTEKEYLELDRNIYYKKGAETVALSVTDYDTYTDDVLFFIDYFDLATKGLYNEYNALFSENYYKSNEPYYSFTQQMIYDINIEKLGQESSDAKEYYYFNVSYRIHKNNGTFRNDIDSDGSKTLFFTLVEENGTILIDSINYYKSK